MPKSETVLVLGGAGFIGSHLVDALVERGHRVRVLDALVPQVHGSQPYAPSGLPHNLPAGVQFCQADIADGPIIKQALDGVDVVFHQAAEVGVGQSMYEIVRYTRANTLGTAVLLELLAAERGSVRKLIVASSMSIYGEGAYSCASHGTVYPLLRPQEQLERDEWQMRCPQCGEIVEPVPTAEDKPLYPTSIYAINKRDQEEMCLVVGRSYGIPTVALRYFNTYGPRQALSNPYTGVGAIFSSRLLNDKAPLIFEDGEQLRDFTHVSDIVQANILAMENDGADYEALNVGTGQAVSIKHVAEVLAAGLGKKIKPEITGKFRAGDIRDCYGDISKARRLLGYEPKVQFEDGMEDLLRWVREQEATDSVEAATSELATRGLTV